MQAAKEFREAIETAMNRTQTRIAKAQRGAPGRGSVGGEGTPGAGNTVTLPDGRVMNFPDAAAAAAFKKAAGL